MPRRTLPKETSQLLQAVYEAALDHGLGPRLAEAYGAWTLCFHQYCARQEALPPKAAQVPGFLHHLKVEAEVSDAGRDQALDAVMFALADVFPERGMADAEERPSSPGGRMLTELLLACDVRLSDAVRLRVGDVDLLRNAIRLPDPDTHALVAIPEGIQGAFKAYVRDRRDAADTYAAPLFPSAYAKYVDKGSDDDAEAATRVMRTLFIEM